MRTMATHMRCRNLASSPQGMPSSAASMSSEALGTLPATSPSAVTWLPLSSAAAAAAKRPTDIPPGDPTVVSRGTRDTKQARAMRLWASLPRSASLWGSKTGGVCAAVFMKQLKAARQLNVSW